MRGRCCPLLRAFWGAVDERDRFTWKQSDASLALCVVRVALSPCQSDLPGSKLYLGHFRAVAASGCSSSTSTLKKKKKAK